MTTEKPKVNSTVTAEWSDTPDGRVLTLKVHGAENDTITFRPADASPANRAHAEEHGWEQRLRDRAAIGTDPKTGKRPTPNDRAEAIRSLRDHYATGTLEWSPRVSRTPRELTVDEKKALFAKLAAELGVEVPTAE
jgi:hypothetical protein